VRAAAAAIGGRLRIPRPTLALRVPSPGLRRRLFVLPALCLLLAAGYQFWLRDSSFVAVDAVKVSGLTTKDAKRVRAALMNAGQTMTTLHIDQERLQQAVEGYPVVSSLEVRPDFPHGLTIHVIEHHAAGYVLLGGQKVAVSSDGTLLRGIPVDRRMPAIEVKGGVRDERLSGRAASGAARIAGAAPGPLGARVERVEWRQEDGLVVELHDGPELIFGDASRTRAKWIAAARVLADPDAEGASYVDLRLPGRPAAGGLPAETVAPVAPAGQAVSPGAAGAVPVATGIVPGTATTPGAGAATTPPAAGTTPAPTGAETAQAPTQPGTTAPATVPPASTQTVPGQPRAPAGAPTGLGTAAAGTGTAAGGTGVPPG
jgi:cell division protein FtsQ